MVYIYDILLNFNKNLIEYFEWEDSDNIKYVKKIMLIKTTKQVIEDIIKKEIIFESEFIKSIPKYEMNGQKDAGSLCLFTDGLIVIGTLIKNNVPVAISRLLLDEESEALEEAEKLNVVDLEYKVLKDKEKENNFLTRREKEIKEKLQVEIDRLYNNEKKEELMYLYYEFTNSESANIDYIYKYLKNSLINFEEKHFNLFDILLLSNANLE